MSSRKSESPSDGPRVTRVIVVDAEDPDPAALETAAAILRAGGLVAFATETVYGLGAIATDPAAVARIFAAKERPAINPVIVHVTTPSQAGQCVADWSADAQALAERFWPGPLTMVLPRSSIIPDEVTAGGDHVAVRAPAGPVARGLIERTGIPIAAPSANRANRLSPTRADHVLADLDGRVDLILDSGPTALGLESTVVDLTSSPPRLLRPGPISIDDLEAALGVAIVEFTPTTTVPRLTSPGQMPVHYAPATRAFRVDSVGEIGEMGCCENMALVVMGDHDTGPLSGWGALFTFHTPVEASRQLYDTLHRCDGLGVASIVVLMPPDQVAWRAVRDRLMRATRPLR
jgi:L-threonylcarbamoyladenylate synthase